MAAHGAAIRLSPERHWRSGDGRFDQSVGHTLGHVQYPVVHTPPG